MAETSHYGTNRVVVAVILITLGVLLLLGMNLLWPLFILVPGLILLGVALAGKPSTAGLAIPGMLISGTGALLFIQNLTGYWDSWAYAWTLYAVFLGMGLVLTGQLSNNESIQSVGRGFMWVGLCMFVGFAFLFELVIGIGDGLGHRLGPFVLIGLGVYMLLRQFSGEPGFPSFALRSKRKRSQKRLFTGPVVYGSTTGGQRDTSRLSVSEKEREQ
jgi:hypothetical protein